MSYFRDWFGRDADYGYTGYDPRKRYISWDAGYDNYSDFFFGRRGKTFTKDNAEEAAQLLYTMSKVVGIKRNEFGLHANHYQALIPTDMLGDPAISTDVFIGAALQNIGAHVHQSSEERLKMSKAKSGKMNLAKFVQTVINAERVSKLMADDTPGYLKFVQKYKEYKYKTRKLPESTDKKHRFLELFDRIIRYPENITEEELEEFKDPIAQIQDSILKQGGIPTDFDDANKLSRKISGIIKKYFEEEQPPKDDKTEDEGEDGDESSDESSGGGFGGGAGGDDEGEGGESGMSDAEFIKSLMDQMEENKVDNADKFKQFIEEFKNQELGASATKIAAEIVPLRDIHDTDKHVYDRIVKKLDLTKARVISTLLRRKSRDYQFAIKSTKSGRLDTNKLAEAKQHVPTVYEQIGKVTTNKLNVVILVDESGSMHGTKIHNARMAAIFLNECLKDVPDVRLFIYGHSADETKGGTTQLRVYREPGKENPLNLVQLEGRCENRDGVAIHSTAKRVKQFAQDNVVMIVISDGEPSAKAYRGEEARTHTRRMVNEVEKMGFQILQVTIGGYRSTDMFKHVINMDDISKFPTQFTNFLKKKINSMIKERVTI